MSDVIDLDVFVPEPRTIKFQGKEITINSPRTIDLIQLGHAVTTLDEGLNLPDKELQILIDNLSNRIFNIVPDLRDQLLSKAQIQKLVEIIADMARPEETKALQAKGITLNTSKKAR